MILGLDATTYIALVISAECVILLVGIRLLYSCAIPYEGVHERRDSYAWEQAPKHHARSSPRIREAQREAWEAQCGEDSERGEDQGRTQEDGEESGPFAPPLSMVGEIEVAPVKVDAL